MRHLFSRLLRGLTLWLIIGQGVGAGMAQAQAPVWRSVVVGPGNAATARQTAVDAAGNAYVCGTFTGTVAFGSTTLVSTTGQQSLYVAKLSAAGQWVWAAKAGGEFNHTSWSDAPPLYIELDGSGNVYVGGSFISATVVFGTTTLAGVVAQNGTLTADVFVAKLNPAGQWQWAVKGGGDGMDKVNAMAVDAAGNVAVGGVFGDTYCSWAVYGTKALAVTGAYDTDLFVARANASGQWQWAEQSSGCGTANAKSLAFDAAGNLVVGGNYTSSCQGQTPHIGATALPGPFGGLTALLARLDPTGHWQWAVAPGPSGLEVRHVVTAPNGDIYLTRWAGAAGMVVEKYSGAGQVIWTGPVTDVTWEKLLLNGSTLYAGATIHWGTPLTVGANQLTTAGNQDVAVVGASTATGQWQKAIRTESPLIQQWPATYTQLLRLGVASNGEVLVSGLLANDVGFPPLVATNPTPGRQSPWVARMGLTTAAAAISSFTPVIGGTGTIVTLSGTNLTGATKVYINQAPATGVTANAAGTQVTAVVPATALTGRVTVVTPQGWAQTASDFTYVPVPTITAYTPLSGPAGTVVTVTGANYATAAGASTLLSVNLGNVSVPFRLVQSTPLTNTKFSFTVPAGAVPGKIKVTTYGGSKTTVSSFTVTAASVIPTITSFTPTSGVPGTVVTINGTNFTGMTSLSIGAGSATGTVNAAGTQITTVLTASACTGPISVATPSGTGRSAGSLLVAPTLLTMSPAYGPPGTRVNLDGNSLAGVTGVTLNGTAAAFIGIACGRILMTVPAGATSGRVRVVTSAGATVSGSDFTVVPPLQLAADQVTGAVPGQEVVVPIRVTGFDHLLGLQGRVEFDTTRLTLMAMEQVNPALSAGMSFGLRERVNGRLYYQWTTPSGAGQTVAGTAVLFAARFLVNSAPTVADTAAIKLPTTRDALTAVRDDGYPPEQATVAGSVRINAGVPVTVTGAVAGAGRHWGIGNVLVTARMGTTGVGPARITTASSQVNGGDFTFPDLVRGVSYTLVAQVLGNDTQPYQGVTVADAVVMQRHVLGISLLGNAYKVISADVDKSGSVTMAEVALVQDLVLRNRTTFPHGQQWQFVRPSQTFANPNAPWPVDSTISLPALTANPGGQSIWGCKLGDADLSWPNALPRPGPGAAAAVVQVADADVVPGGRVRVAVTLVGAAAGAQFTLTWPDAELRLVGVHNRQPGVVMGRATGGQLPVMWTEAVGAATGSRRLLELELEAIGEADTDVLLRVTDDVTERAAADGQGLPQTLDGQAGTVHVVTRTLGEGGELIIDNEELSVWPNPARGVVQVRGAQGCVELVDGLGRVTRRVQPVAGAAVLDTRGLPAGLYTVRAGGAGKRLVINN